MTDRMRQLTEEYLELRDQRIDSYGELSEERLDVEAALSAAAAMRAADHPVSAEAVE